MSFYLDRLEAARRQQRMMEGCALTPRARPCYQYHQHAALLPRPQHRPPVPPLHGGEGGVGHPRGGAPGTWPGTSVARREAALASPGAAGGTMASARAAGWLSESVAPAREEAGGVGAGEVGNKRCSMEPATQARCSPPKRRAVSARRRFPPGCGRDATAGPLPVTGHDGSLFVHAPRDGSSGVQQGTGPPPSPATPLAGRKGSVLFEAAASPSAAAAASGGGSTALNKVSASDGAAWATPNGAHHCPGAALGKPSEVPGKNSVPAADGLWNTYDTGSHGNAGTASDDQLLKSKDNLAPSMRLLPRPGRVSAHRRFPPGCGRRGSPLVADGGIDKVWPPPSEEVVRPDRDEMEVVVPLCSGTADGAAKNEKLEEEVLVASEAQESPIATLHNDATACTYGASAAGIGAMEVCASHTTTEEMIGSTWQCEDNKPGGSSCNGLPKEHMKGDSVSECATTMNTASSGAAARVSYDGAMMRKVMLTPRKSVKPPKSIQKPALNTQCRPFSQETEETDNLARHTANDIEDKNEFTAEQAMQDPKSADKFPLTKGKEAATVSHYLGPEKKVNVKRQMDETEDSNMEDILCKLAVDKVWPPPSEEMVRSDQDDMEVVAPLCSGTANVVAKNEKWEEEVASEAQESPSATLHDDDTACRHGASAAGIGAMEVCASRTTSTEEMTGSTWQCEENKAAGGGSSCNVLAESSADSVSECAITNTASSGAAATGSYEGTMMRKVMFTPRKSVKPHKSIQKPALNTQCRPFSKETETDQLARHTANDIEDKNEVTAAQAMQDPKSADKFPWRKGKEAATVSHYCGPKKKVNVKRQMDEMEDSNMEDILSKLAVDQGNFERGPQSADARSRVKMMCTQFESICRTIVLAVERRSLKVRRIDLAADKLIRKLPGFTKLGPIVGDVPGVEVGDQFLYRVELALVGLHRPYQGGIDTTRDEDGVLIAISVVASGGYPDELSCPGELVYTGSGGKKGDGDQKLEHGNLALKNCINRKVPVRVIHGFKGQNREGCSHSRAREITTFTYDGLYRVVKCWREGRPGSKVFKYKLQRIPGQPRLPLHVAKLVRKNDILV